MTVMTACGLLDELCTPTSLERDATRAHWPTQAQSLCRHLHFPRGCEHLNTHVGMLQCLRKVMLRICMHQSIRVGLKLVEHWFVTVLHIRD